MSKALSPERNLVAEDIDQPPTMFDMRMSQEQMLEYGQQLDRIAGDLKYWVHRHSQDTNSNSPSRRNLQILKPASKVTKDRSRSVSQEGA